MRPIQATLRELRGLLLPAAVHLDERIDRAPTDRAALLALLGSKEFRKTLPVLFNGLPYDYRRGPVETETDEETLSRLFERVARVWSGLGESEAAWSVLSDDQYRGAMTPEVAARFYQSGVRDVDAVIGALARNGIEPPFRLAVEYGCGLARMSHAFAAHCARLVAYDISPSHLQAARQAVAERGIENVTFERVSSPQSPLVEGYDFFYTNAVLQHNPPPIIAYLLRKALSGLAPGGVAVFHVPVHRNNYSYKIGSTREAIGERQIEMHILPQAVMFRIIAETGCDVLDVTETSINLRDRIISNTVTVRKPG